MKHDFVVNTVLAYATPFDACPSISRHNFVQVRVILGDTFTYALGLMQGFLVKFGGKLKATSKLVGYISWDMQNLWYPTHAVSTQLCKMICVIIYHIYHVSYIKQGEGPHHVPPPRVRLFLNKLLVQPNSHDTFNTLKPLI